MMGYFPASFGCVYVRELPGMGGEIGSFGLKIGEILRDGIASGRGVHRF